MADVTSNAERARYRANRTFDTSGSVLTRDRRLIYRESKLLEELQEVQERQEAQSRGIAALQEMQKRKLRLVEPIHHHLVMADNMKCADRDGIPSTEVPRTTVLI